MSSLHHISRIDNDERFMHAWRVRVQRKTCTINKSFSDSHYGGKQKALLAAKAYRDELIGMILPLDYQVWMRTRVRKNNVSGIPGVSHHVVRNADGSIAREFWLASWTNEHGMTRQSKFSVKLLGHKKAKQLAINARALNLQRVCELNCEKASQKPRSR